MKKLLMFYLLLLPLAISSCGEDNDEPTTHTTIVPDETITFNVNLGSSISVGDFTIELGDEYKFSCYKRRHGFISIIGQVNGIDNIKLTEAQIHSLTWAQYATAQVGYGYIFRVSNWNNKYSPYSYDYYAVYVASEIGNTSDGVKGYTLKVRKLLENVPPQN